MASSLGRGLEILDLLSRHNGEMNLAEIAEQTGIPKSTAHRLLTELDKSNFARKGSIDGTYGIGLKTAVIGLRHFGRNPQTEIARPTLQKLAEISGELARLSLYEDGNLFWVAKEQSARTGIIFHDPDMGAQVGLTTTASGIALLSIYATNKLRKLLNNMDVPDEEIGANYQDYAEKVETAVTEAQKNGYSYSASRYIEGLASLACPLIDAESKPIGVISIAGPEIRLTKERVRELGPTLVEETKKLNQILVE